MAEATPILSKVIREGMSQGIFDCEQVEERVRMVLIISLNLFYDDGFTENDVIALAIYQLMVDIYKFLKHCCSSLLMA